MGKWYHNIILQSTGATSLYEIEIIQSLWSGYGSIVRYGLKDSKYKTIVVKHVSYPSETNHPRGWNTDLSHLRKLKSYEVETAWYKHWSNRCNETCRIPNCLALESKDDEVLMVLEDLDAAGFPVRKSSVNWNEIEACLNWLANFHATFLNETPEGLWEIGSYWHLDTRPEELEELTDIPLKNAASIIDSKLTNANFKTFVHGDAKLANFCFSKNGLEVAALDFQYVGGGCGLKDVAYFVGSCLYEDDCEKYEAKLLDTYFAALRNALNQNHSSINLDAMEEEWRSLYPYAWTDFHRFLKGWSPGHWKINSYSERMAKQVILQLKK
ncbi:MAG: DUF1679 domain-containing protein [Prolixibacteraceae bacterium]|jgi:hypothetical protein|nr:DUF1679 domain-containing protein [Prolixibacteraceae bacterium]